MNIILLKKIDVHKRRTESKILKNLKKSIIISLVPSANIKDDDIGKMTIHRGRGEDIIVKIVPLFDENNFKFTNQEMVDDKNIKGKNNEEDRKGKRKMNEIKKRSNKKELDYTFDELKGVSFN